MKRIVVSIGSSIVALAAAISAQAQSYSNAVQALKPVAYWPLTESAVPSGGLYIATNSGSAGAAGNGYYETWWQTNGNPGQLTNGNSIVHIPGAIVGDSDTAMQDGVVGQYVVIPRAANGVANPVATITAPFSIEAWIFPTNNSGTLKPIIAEGFNNIINTNLYDQFTTEGTAIGMFNGFVYFNVFNGNAVGNPKSEIDTAGLTLNQWYHIVATFDGTNQSLFTNGVLVRTITTPANSLGQRYVVDPVSPLIIGGGNELGISGGANGPSFGSGIDEVAIYGTNLTAAQISTHYQNGTNSSRATPYAQVITGDNPTIYLRLDEPAFTGPTIAGLPVANNYGSLGAAANGFYLPGATPGVAGPSFSGFGSGTAVALNGFNSGVDVGSGALPSQLNPTNFQPMTVTAWFKGNPADCFGRFQIIAGHSDLSWRLALDNTSGGNHFNPGNGPELQFLNIHDALLNGGYVNDGNWHFLAGVSDGTNDFMYVDGVLVKSGTGEGVVSAGSAQDVILGGDPQYMAPQPASNVGGGGRWFDGSLAQVAFFTNALSGSQISGLFNAAGVAPFMVQQPVSRTLFSGVNASIAAVADGSGPLSYQWYNNSGNTPVGGQTTSALTFSPATAGNAGNYYLVVTNNSGAVTSAVIQVTVSASPASAYQAAIMQLNPVGFWPLNESVQPPAGVYIATNLGTLGASANAFYQSWYQPILIGNTNTFFATNNIRHIAGITGDGDQAMSTGSAGQYVVLPRFANGVANSNATISGSPINGAFTIEAWIELGTNSGLRPIITEGRNQVMGGLTNNPAFTNDEYGFSLGEFNALLYFQTYSGKTFANGGNTEIDTANLQTNVWYHVVAGFDGANIFVYTNGVQVGASKPSTFVPDPISPLIIGSGTDVPAGNGGLEFIGGIDDVAIYSTNLSAAQVLAHFNATNGPNYAATILADSPSMYYRLDEPAFNSYPSRSSYPVAFNYGTVGTAGNGVYEPGTAVGAAGPTFPGLSGNTAVAINGDYGAVDVGGGQIPLQLNPVGNAPQTIVAWFQLDPADARFQEIASRGDNSYRLAINGNNSANGSTAPWDNEYNPGNNPQPGFANLSDVLTNGARFNDGNWHMVAGVSDGSTASLYLDGQLAKQAGGVGSLAGTNWDFLIGTSPAHITPLATGANLRYLLGQIAQVAYFTNALTAAQIQQIENVVGSPLTLALEPPATQTNNVGTVATVTTVVRGSSPVFQWYSLNTNTDVSTPVSGQTNASLVFNPANLSENGNYFLIATNTFNAVTSSVCQLTIVGPPQLVSQSANDLRVFVGTTPSIHLAVIGPSLAFQWRSNNAAIPNATNPVYTLTTSDTSSTGSNVYSCVITNSFGSTNATIPVVVLADPTAPYPATVLGDKPSYYFRLDEPDTGFPNDGVTGYDYAGGQNAYYTNTVLGAPGYSSATEPLDTAAGFGIDASPDSFLGQGSPYLDLATPNGSNAEFTVECWVNSAEQTQVLDAGIVCMGFGFGGEEFDIDTPNNQLRFYVRNTTGTSFAASSTVSLPANSWHHIAGVCDEAAGKLSFYIDGVLAATSPVPTNSGIEMQTLPLSIGSRVSSNGVPHYDNQFVGYIDDVAIYSYALSASQIQSHYFIAGIAPLITQVSPQSTSINPGSTVSFTVTATGTQPLFYEWSDPTSTPIPGATNATLVLSNVQASQAGQYTVTVSNPYGSPSTNVNLTVNTGPAAISTDLTPLNQNVFAGEVVSYTIAAAGDTPIFYQWFQDGNPVSGATNATFTFTALLGTNTYFCTASNAQNVGSPATSSTGTVVGMPSTTLNPADYTDHVKITFSGFNLGQTLQDFPVLVQLSTNIPGFNYAHLASATGGDLRFTDAGGSVIIPSEIDEWHPNGTSIVWVQVPTLSSSNNFIWAYWGNPGNTTPPPGTNVWVPPSWQGLPSYDVVYHLKESGFPYFDSTGVNPSTNGTAPTLGTGLVGLGENFASPSFLDVGSNNLDSQVTLSAWVNLLASDTAIQTVWANKNGGFANAGFALYVNDFNHPGNGQIEMENGDGVSTSFNMQSASGAFPLGSWHLLTAVLDTSNNLGRIYVDTNLVASGALHTGIPMTNDLNLGTFIGGAFPLNGTIDEARIQFGTNSPAWITAEYLNIAQNSTFQSFSSVTSTVANGPVTILFQKSGANLIMDGSGGSANGEYRVLSSTNVALPIAQWVPVQTNNFDGSGNFSNAVPINSTNKSLFFRIAVP